MSRGCLIRRIQIEEITRFEGDNSDAIRYQPTLLTDQSTQRAINELSFI
jgi:hypothetical protein